MNLGDLIASLRLDYSNYRIGLSQVQAQTSTAAASINRNLNGINANGPINEMRRLDNETRRVTWAVRGYLRDAGRIASGIMISQAFYSAINSIQDAGKALFNFNNQMQQSSIAFTIMLGNAEAAKGMLQELQDFAATTPFGFSQAADGAQKLLAAGFKAQEVIPVLRGLSDAVAIKGASPENMERIIYAITQIKTFGRLMGPELRQLTEAGLPAFKIIQKELGLTAEQMAHVGKLGIPADTAIRALLNGISKYAKGASQQVATTTQGMIQQIGDVSLIVGNTLFSPIFDGFRKGLSKVTAAMMELRQAARDGGAGGIINHLFPPELQTSIRAIVGSLEQVGSNIVQIIAAFGPSMRIAGGMFIQTLGVILPAINSILTIFRELIQYAMSNSAAVRILTIAIAGLMIAGTVARTITLLGSAIRLLAIAGPIAGGVMKLGGTIVELVMALTPIGRVVAIAVASLMVLAASSENVSSWLNKIIKQLGSLGGFNVNKILQPEATKASDDWWKKVTSSLGGAADATDDVGNSTDKAGKKAKQAAKDTKNWIAAFDEVFSIPDKLDNTSNALDGLGKNIKLPKLDTGIPKDGDKLPRKVDMPKLVFEKPDWPIIPPELLKPIHIRFNIDKPNWPDMPGSAVTTWATTMDTLRGKINSTAQAWNTWWGSLPVAVRKGLSTAANPIPNGMQLVIHKVLDPLANLKDDWIKEWNGLGDDVNTALVAVQGIAEKDLIKVRAKVKGFFNELQPAWSRGWTQVRTSLAPIWKQIQQDVSGYTVPVVASIGIMIAGILQLLNKNQPQIGTAAAGLAAKIVIPFGTVGDRIHAKLLDVPHKISSSLVYDRVISDAIKLLKQHIVDPFEPLGALIKLAIKNIPTKISETIVYNKDISTAVKEVKTHISEAFSPLGSMVKAAVKNIPSKISDAIVYNKDISAAIKTVKEHISSAFNPLGSMVKSAVKNIPTKIGEAMSYTKSLSKTITNFKNNITDPFWLLGLGIKSATKNTPAKIAEIMVMDKILKTSIENFKTAIVKKFTTLPDAIKGAIKDIPKKFHDVMGGIKIPDFTVTAAATGYMALKATQTFFRDVPGFATGGIIGKDSIVRVGEQGRREAIIPLQNGKAMAPFANAVAQQLMDGLGINSSSTQNITNINLGSLIGDERSLRELERKLQMIRQTESSRRRSS